MAVFAALLRFSQSRISWLLLLTFVILFELCALYFQHIMLLSPCVMCIYERIALFGVGLFALVGLSAPHLALVRWLGLVGWGYTAYRGLMLALKHVDLQFNPSPFVTCDLFVMLPSWAPLNEWLPWLFEAYGDCSEIQWLFLSLSMPQWLVIIFAGNLIACAVFILAQLSALYRK